MTDLALPKQRVAFVDPKDGTVTREWWQWILNPSVTNLKVASGITVPTGTISALQLQSTHPITVASGGLGIASGTSGGILGFTGATTLASSALLGANQIVLGGGAGVTPSTPLGLGSAHVVLHGNAAGAPTWSAVDLAADVSGLLPAASVSGLGTMATVNSPVPVANGGTGQTAAGAAAANAIGALAEASNLSDLANAATARTNLGLGTMATQAANAVAITGGTAVSSILTGTTTNDNAAAGVVGQYVTATAAPGAVNLTTNTAANVTSVSLTAGDWDVNCVANFTPSTTTSITVLDGGASSTSATLGAQDTFFEWSTPAIIPGTTVVITYPAPTQRFSLSGTTTVFLVVKATFTASTLTAGGTIRARRMR